MGTPYKEVPRELTAKNRKWAGIPEGGYWCNTKNGMIEYAKAHGGEEWCMLGWSLPKVTLPPEERETVFIT